METAALLLTACLFGGMVFFSFGFAPVLFKQLPIAEVRPLLRGTFPYYYAAVIVVALVATLVAVLVSETFGRGPAILLASIAFSTIAARQILMPMINQATDQGDKKRFARLHGLSVVIQLVQIALSGWAVVLLATAR